MDRLNLRIGLGDAMVKLCWDRVTDGVMTDIADEVDLYCARNGVVGAQVRVLADEPYVLSVDRTNWLHALGFQPRVRLEVRFPSLPGDAVEVFPVGYVEGDDRREWMEYLSRAGYAEVPPYRPQAVYIRVRVPANLRPGMHEGEVRAYTQTGFEDETAAWEGTIRLHVAETVLPDVSEWSYHLDLWQHCTAIARQHGVALWSDDHFALIDHYYASLAQLGQKAVSVMATEIPWSGQRCFRDRQYPSYLFEHAVVDVARDEQGELHYGYDKLDRQLALATRHGIDDEIEVFGLLNIWVDERFGFGKVAPDAPDAIRVRCFDERMGTMTYLRTAGELRGFVRALRDHFAERGVLERVRVTADEPSDLEAFNERLAFLQEAAPGLRYKVAINHFDFLEYAPPEVVDAVPNLVLTCRNPDLTAEVAEALHERGGKMLWYICCGPPRPNVFIHSPLVEGVLLGWLTHLFGLDGFLRWDFCLWPADPWRRVSWRAPHWSAGDMFFVLPGKDGAPVETLRYEALRTAVQDYELIKLVERRLDRAEAQDAIDGALARILRTEDVADFSRVYELPAEALYSLDAGDYAAARRMLLEALDINLAKVAY
jgi:hypothetical protein